MPHVLRIELSGWLRGILISTGPFWINSLVEIIDFHFMRILCASCHHTIFSGSTTSRILLLKLRGMVDIILALVLLIFCEIALLHRRIVMLVYLGTFAIFFVLLIVPTWIVGCCVMTLSAADPSVRCLLGRVIVVVETIHYIRN